MTQKLSSIAQRLDHACDAIDKLFREQCLHGEQTKPFAPDAAACGQFLNELENDQRGLHGTVAAIRVLRESRNADSQALVRRLTSYLNNRQTLEAAIPGQPPDIASRLEADSRNIIKTGEALWALSNVPAGVCKTDHLVEAFKTQLLQAMVDAKAWPFFADDNDVAIVPTAYATIGLGRIGHDVTRPLQYLKDELARLMPKSSSINANDVPLATLCLFAITFYKDYSLISDGDADSTDTFRKLWRAAEPLLILDIEQNFAYSRPLNNHYVRIPWQLYLMALAARHRTLAFATVPMQRRFRAILTSLEGQRGFRYPHSEHALSSRTHAIVFEVLLILRVELRHRFTVAVLNGFDRLRRVIGSRAVRYAAVLVALAIVANALWTYFHSEPRSMSDLGPDLLTSLVIGLLTLGKRGA